MRPDQLCNVMASMPDDAALSDQRKSLGGQPEHLEVLSKAIGDLAASRPPFAHEVMVRLADLRRRQGRIEEAERLFREAESHPMAAVGMAELSLDRNDPGEGHSCGRASAATPSAGKQDSAGRRTRARRKGQVPGARPLMSTGDVSWGARSDPATGPRRRGAELLNGIIGRIGGSQRG